MRIPLFDIDNTLLEGGNRAHMGAYDFAIRTVYKRKASVSEISIDGMIDTQIIVEVLTRHGMSAQAVKRRMPEAIQAMNEHFVAHADEGKSRVMPGVLELLKALRKRACPMGLLSGNVEDIGWEKLRLGGINEYFQFGAFGSLAYRRVDLIPVALRRAQAKYLSGRRQDFVIVGDTPLDVACAKRGLVDVIGVGAGKFSADDLERAGADLVVDTLQERGRILEFLRVV